ncbi:MAG TPA: NAD-dependent epimerase/dehydratase family protein [Acidimicrobiales bacterium]|nr:NAD-dependent epimerase/dehydratase family protein [Acidimicrobiales bacterium]
MRVVVTGATGNVGTSVVESLLSQSEVDEVVGLSRRRPEWGPSGFRWVRADVAVDDLLSTFEGADAVVHLAWLFQPTHDPVTTWASNVSGSIRVFESAAAAGVRTVVYNSSVGAYSPGPKFRAVDESWPTDGWAGAAYTREKAYVERSLDVFELRNPEIRVVRMRPGFIFKEESASEQRRLFLGPLVPQRLIRPGLIPIVPDLPGLRMQVVHTADVGDAIARAVVGSARGAFNLASEPVVDPAVLAEWLDARIVPVPLPVARTALSLAWWAHLVPATRGLFDAVLHLPVMDCRRAETELGWTARFSARQALDAAFEGMRKKGGMSTPPLAPDTPAGRARELSTGVGRRP